MNTRMMLVAVLVLGSLSPVIGQEAESESSEKVLLRWKFKKGDLLRYEMNNMVETDVQGMKMEQEMIFGMKQEILEVDEKGTADIRVTYDRVALDMTGMMVAKYDSETDKTPPAGNPLVAFFAAFVGEFFQMKMDSRGTVLEVTGLDKMMERITRSLGEENAMMAGMLKQQYDGEKMKGQMQQGFSVLPENPVGPGDTWNTEMDTIAGAGAGTMLFATVHTLKELRKEEGIAVVEQDTVISTGNEDADGAPAAMVRIKEGKGKSLMRWDVDRGRLSSTKGTTDIDMEATGMAMRVSNTMNMALAPRDEEVKTPTGSTKDSGDEKEGEKEEEKEE